MWHKTNNERKFDENGRFSWLKSVTELKKVSKSIPDWHNGVEW